MLVEANEPLEYCPFDNEWLIEFNNISSGALLCCRAPGCGFQISVRRAKSMPFYFNHFYLSDYGKNNPF